MGLAAATDHKCQVPDECISTDQLAVQQGMFVEAMDWKSSDWFERLMKIQEFGRLKM